MSEQIKEQNEETTIVSADWYLAQKASNDETVKVAASNILPNDSVTGAKMINGIVKKRQGGSSTIWTTTGITDYDTSSENVKIQCGTIAAGASPQTVTFGEAFTYAPLVLVCTRALTANCYATLASNPTTTAFTVQVLTDAGAGNNSQVVNWIAIGV